LFVFIQLVVDLLKQIVVGLVKNWKRSNELWFGRVHTVKIGHRLTVGWRLAARHVSGASDDRRLTTL